MENGDLTWIIPNKLVAFSSPSDSSTDKNGVYKFIFRTK